MEVITYSDSEFVLVDVVCLLVGWLVCLVGLGWVGWLVGLSWVGLVSWFGLVGLVD